MAGIPFQKATNSDRVCQSSTIQKLSGAEDLEIVCSARLVTRWFLGYSRASPSFWVSGFNGLAEEAAGQLHARSRRVPQGLIGLTERARESRVFSSEAAHLYNVVSDEGPKKAVFIVYRAKQRLKPHIVRSLSARLKSGPSYRIRRSLNITARDRSTRKLAG